MTHTWEKPVKAVFDYFNINDATLIGLSLGGYFAVRAAAYEKRIKRVVAWNAVYDFFECVFGRNGILRYMLINVCVSLGLKRIINSLAKKQMQKDQMMKWIYEHLMFTFGAENPFDYMKKLKQYKCKKDISSLVLQDVLLLAGTHDHIIPFRMYGRQLKALINAKSVEGRVFTAGEHGAEHCQIGNITLASDYIAEWIIRKSTQAQC
jgi:pimeloyl-ACP methyl ester carboxylesterase